MEQSLPEKFERIIKFDKREIDNSDVYYHARLNCLDRLYKIVSILCKRFSNPEQVAIADIGCAQGNLSLVLAEKFFLVTAVDIEPIYMSWTLCSIGKK